MRRKERKKKKKEEKEQQGEIRIGRRENKEKTKGINRKIGK